MTNYEISRTQVKKTHRLAEDSVTESSGNVFADLGIKDAAAYFAKSVLAIHIQRVIEKHHLKQDEAGRILGINQPKVSAIIKGRLDGFSTKRLFRFLNALGVQADISKRPNNAYL
jgi:predicted XRE-type DNA-binding protein